MQSSMTTKEKVQTVKNKSLFNCLYEEIVRGSAVGEDDTKYLIKEQQIITFLNIPWELEKVLYLGYLVCLDAFLFIFTFLPVRTLCAIVKMLCWFLRKLFFLRTYPIDKGLVCDLFRLTIMFVCLGSLSRVNISMLYHLIRGQSVIKLYFIYNVLEILDYLCLSFGNDVMDALFWLTIRNKCRKREHLSLLWHLVLACIYTLIHSLCFLVQAICLSVAINSHNKSLLVVMTTNQYMELKSYLFKKFDKSNFYQVVARDIRERFQYTVIIIVVFMRNMSQLEWQTSHMYDILPDIVLIICSEVAIDWIKHAFVTRFNGIPAKSYIDYRYQLYDDLLNPALYKQTFSNRMDLMARKILFIPMPLACLTVTVLIEVIPEDIELGVYDYLKYGGVIIIVLFILKLINMGLIIHNAERLRNKCAAYETPKVPPIRNVNSSVQLRVDVPPTEEEEERDKDNLEEDPLVRTVLVSGDLSNKDVPETSLTSSVSAPQLITEYPPDSPRNLEASTYHTPERWQASSQLSPASSTPSPTVPFLISSSLETSPSKPSNSSPESMARDLDERSRDLLSQHEQSLASRDFQSRDSHCRCKCLESVYKNSTLITSSVLESPSGTENEPPKQRQDNARNVNFNDNFTGDGVRKRTVDGALVED